MKSRCAFKIVLFRVRVRVYVGAKIFSSGGSTSTRNAGCNPPLNIEVKNDFSDYHGHRARTRRMDIPTQRQRHANLCTSSTSAAFSCTSDFLIPVVCMFKKAHNREPSCFSCSCSNMKHLGSRKSSSFG